MKKVIAILAAVIAIASTFFLPAVIRPDGSVDWFAMLTRITVCFFLGIGLCFTMVKVLRSSRNNDR